MNQSSNDEKQKKKELFIVVILVRKRNRFSKGHLPVSKVVYLESKMNVLLSSCGQGMVLPITDPSLSLLQVALEVVRMV